MAAQHHGTVCGVQPCEISSSGTGSVEDSKVMSLTETTVTQPRNERASNGLPMEQSGLLIFQVSDSFANLKILYHGTVLL